MRIWEITIKTIKPIKPKKPLTLPQLRIHSLQKNVERDRQQLKAERERQRQKREAEHKQIQQKNTTALKV